MELAIIKLTEEIEYEQHLVSKGFYDNKTEHDPDGTKEEAINRIKSYIKAVNQLSND
ncbi:MAG: hypothetical protein MK076_00780 [Flavobacteriales bacterium]|nr:hypothetical protein [Flavobacteriales bacterium]